MFEAEKRAGDIAEENFRNLFESKGYTVNKTNFQDDVYNHFDFIVEKDGVVKKFEVKAAKKDDRNDNKASFEMTWIELKGIKGYSGWVYGQADYFAFEQKEGFIISKRKDIVDLILQKLVDNNFERGKGMYQIYGREGREDIIVKILFKDLENKRIVK
jgi:Holliday junction resolvase-like predicted endonuclease